jgi:formylglycine-generating enzyme required for sulfatase activity
MNEVDVLEANPAFKNEKGADGMPFRVLRGGSWPVNTEVSLRSSCRDILYPTDRYVSVGFRLVVSVGVGG